MEMNNEELIKILELSKCYCDGKRQFEAKLPYHLNIIDELYINENGHSRILTKLLQYKSESQRYELLESFIQYVYEVTRKESFESIKVCRPKITQEKERIDLWVRDEDYAIIFENKIYNAADQDAQICRYIDKTREHGYQLDRIYVVYLSQIGNDPEDQSWGSYKDDFQCRYVNLSFRKDILTWLKTRVLPNVRIKETVLRSAIEQYVDYLDGLFDYRTQNKEIAMEMEKMIVEKLGLKQCTSGFDKVKVLQNEIEGLNELYSMLTNLKDKYYEEAREKQLAPHIREWNEEIEALYPEYKRNDEAVNVGLLVPFRGDIVNVCISEDDDKQMYCQIDKRGLEDDVLRPDVIETADKILTRHGRNCIWKYFDINDFDGVFKCFKEVMALLIKG